MLALVDPLSVTPGDLDRMHYAHEDVGVSRVDSMELFLKRVNPDVEIVTIDPEDIQDDVFMPMEAILRAHSNPKTGDGAPRRRLVRHSTQVHRHPDHLHEEDGGRQQLCMRVVFLCGQNGPMAAFLNDLCVELDLLLIYCYVGSNGISGDVISVIPGVSSCLQVGERTR